MPRSGWNGWVIRICGASTAPGAFCSFERRARSNARSNTSGTPSSPPAPSATSTTSTPNSDAGATTSPTADATPTSRTVPSPTSGPKSSPASYRSPPIPSRPNSSAPSAPAKTPYVRFDRNAYSIPHTHVRKPLTLLAGATRVRILDRQTELARHHRSYDTGQTIEDPQHLEGLLAATRQSNAHTTRDRLRVTVPATATLFERLAERGEPLRAHATRLLALLDDYGPQELAAAVAVALERDALGAGSITHILETRRRQRGRKPPLRLTLPNRPGLQDIDVRPHDLETYDALSQHHPDDAGD